MAEKIIEIEDLLKLKELWGKKNWAENDSEGDAFDRFCKVIPYLSIDQKKLVHELVENYLWLNMKEYEKRFKEIIKNLQASTLKGCSKIYLFPIVTPFDDGKIKSGQHCVYILKSILSFISQFAEMPIIVVENYKKLLATNFNDDGSEVLLLIDDFIGSGETFKAAWIEIQKNSTVKLTFISVVALVIQKEAYELLNSLGLNVYTSEIRPKGISEVYSSPEKEEKTRVMEEIEEYIGPGINSFGFKRSEALITLLRTPDNTFPFFWEKYYIKGSKILGPFLRP